MQLLIVRKLFVYDELVCFLQILYSQAAKQITNTALVKDCRAVWYMKACRAAWYMKDCRAVWYMKDCRAV